MPPKPFSGTLNLIDLNDYLGPSQVCIRPTKSIKPSEETNGSSQNTTIRLDESTNSYYESDQNGLNLETKLKKAEISLNDCLACSGCITTSESILVSLQSADEVKKSITEGDLYPIVSVSSHSLASLAAYYNINSLIQTYNLLKKYFTTRLGFRLVLDLGFAQCLHLYEARQEFLERWSRAPTSDLVNSSKADLWKPKPILTSSCPGWICYAEKTQGKSGVLESISKVRSAQQIQGSLVKSDRMAKMLGILKDKIYHVTVMSCYDKKLEASRSDFQIDGLKDVDCVLTTREVQSMMEEDSFHLSDEASKLNSIWPLVKTDLNEKIGFPIWIDHPEPRGSTTGGYLFNIIRSVIRQIPVNDQRRLKLLVDSKRGSDHTEYTLVLEPAIYKTADLEDTGQVSQQVIFHGARFYGFKNLQNLINRLGLNKINQRVQPGRRRRELSQQQKQQVGFKNVDRGFDYVEVMACPSGCVNGGGQIPVPQSQPIVSESNESSDNLMIRAAFPAREWIKKVEERYSSTRGRRVARDGDEESSIISYCERDVEQEKEELEIEDFLQCWNLKTPGRRNRLFRTEYRAIEDEVNGYAVQW
ncbi:iron hydrogenase [Phakopsora pachyrhizi]|uniref:Iron hydrogenase n=1 Tax=Phakopsora pachyrhizi TaxID=170000 RepID=A0AAV0BKU8_PHAPC|nr:iron hydrogenase [Phakopsora pachyrhizi]CAH7687314.1 iron hydrogenase [Phakopsora pachyrhizi]